MATPERSWEEDVSDLEAFRAEVRAWLEASCPPEMRVPLPPSVEGGYWGGRKRHLADPVARLWCERCAERGFTAPTWPREYGGGGLSREQARVLQEEMARIHARAPLSSLGLIMLGPMLLELATEEQKREHLPPIVRGEIRWCQGYSEPGAGSDLAGLSTRAEDRGDHFIVNGQKIWTSYAQDSDWIFCLVRTDPTKPKHEGISFLLIDMDQPGVTTRPIKLISGASPFCQTFFENARAEKRNLIGGLNGGWNVAKRLLQHERQGIATIGAAPRTGGGSARALAQRYCGAVDGRIADARVRDRIAALEMMEQAVGATLRRSGDEARAGQAVGAASSIFKLVGSELNQERQELLVSILGTQGLGWEGEGFAPDELEITRAWLRSKANTIEGGTSEVQLNVIAKRVLGLPD
jgi:alkylation response protein AidB-like acyl-CoA dehydrogenase